MLSSTGIVATMPPLPSPHPDCTHHPRYVLPDIDGISFDAFAETFAPAVSMLIVFDKLGFPGFVQELFEVLFLAAEAQQVQNQLLKSLPQPLQGLANAVDSQTIQSYRASLLHVQQASLPNVHLVEQGPNFDELSQLEAATLAQLQDCLRETISATVAVNDWDGMSVAVMQQKNIEAVVTPRIGDFTSLDDVIRRAEALRSASPLLCEAYLTLLQEELPEAFGLAKRARTA